MSAAAPARVLLLDVDGVIVHPDPAHREAFETVLRSRWGMDGAHFQEQFFRANGEVLLCGRAHVRDLLPAFLAASGVALGDDPAAVVEDFLHDWFIGRLPQTDDAVLQRVAGLRRRGIPVHLATNQDSMRAEQLWQATGLARHFDHMHVSARLGVAKPDAAFYGAAEAATVELCGALGPSDILFLDDKPENVEAARRHGWRAALYERIGDLDRALAEHGLAG